MSMISISATAWARPSSWAPISTCCPRRSSNGSVITGSSGWATECAASPRLVIYAVRISSSLVRSVRIVEPARGDKHHDDNRRDHRAGDDKDPSALDDHFFLRSPLSPSWPPDGHLFSSPTASLGRGVRQLCNYPAVGIRGLSSIESEKETSACRRHDRCR